MRAHVIEDGKITNTIEVNALDALPRLHLVDAAGGGAIGDRWAAGKPIAAPPHTPTQEEYVSAVQAMLDAKARERLYDGILSACTYATSANAKFRAEGQTCVDWRDAVWAKCYEVLAQVSAGALAQPSLAGLLDLLPTMEWPE